MKKRPTCVFCSLSFSRFPPLPKTLHSTIKGRLLKTERRRMANSTWYFACSLTQRAETGSRPRSRSRMFRFGRVTTFNSSSAGAFIMVPRPCVLRSFEVLSSTPFHDPRTFTIVKRSGPSFEFTTISIALDNGQIFGSSPNSVSMAARDAFAIRESKPAGGSLSSAYYFYFTSVCE